MARILYLTLGAESLAAKILATPNKRRLLRSAIGLPGNGLSAEGIVMENGSAITHRTH